MSWKNERVRQLYIIADDSTLGTDVQLEAIRSLGVLAFDDNEAAYVLGELARTTTLNDQVRKAATRELGRERRNYL